jgi:hypothetical protein
MVVNMSWLGNLLMRGSAKVGNMVPVDLCRYRKDAESGVAKAQFALGCFYEQAQHGLEQNFLRPQSGIAKLPLRVMPGRNFTSGFYWPKGRGWTRILWRRTNG